MDGNLGTPKHFQLLKQFILGIVWKFTKQQREGYLVSSYNAVCKQPEEVSEDEKVLFPTLALLPAECLVPGEASPFWTGSPTSAPAERCHNQVQNLLGKHPGDKQSQVIYQCLTTT